MQRGFQGSEDQQQRIQNWVSNALCSSAGDTECIREQSPLSSGDNRAQDVEPSHTVIGNVNIDASHNLDDESSWGYQNNDSGHDVPSLTDDDAGSESASIKSNKSDWSDRNGRAHDNDPALRNDDYFSDLTSVGSEQGNLGGQNGEDNGDGPAMGDDDNISESTSIPSDLELSWQENSRSYHGYEMEEFYPFPEDLKAQDNQRDQHDFLYKVLGGTSQVAPVDWKAAKKVLDAGTGTGCWAIDIAVKNESLQVVGVDLSSITPDWVPRNTAFYLDNIDEDIMGHGYDYIFARSIEIKNWPTFMRRARSSLEEGGWLEIQNPVFIPLGDLPEDSMIEEFTHYMEAAMKKSGRSTTSALLYRQEMEEAGFTHVQEKVYQLPINADSPILGDLDGLLLALATRYLDWEPAKVYVFTTEVRKEIRKLKGAYVYFNFHVVCGQRPHSLAASQIVS